MERKSSLNIFYLISIWALLFLSSGGPLYSQDTQDSTETTSKTEEKMQEGLQDEVHNTEDLESLLKRYNSDQKKRGEGTLTEVKEEEGAELDREAEELPSVPKDPAQLKKILSEKAAPKKEWPKTPSEALRAGLVPFKSMDEARLQEWLKTNFKGSKIDPYLERYPKISLFMTKMIKDPDGLPSLVKIVEDKERLIRFAAVMLLTVVFGFFLKRFFYREKRSFLSAAGLFILRFYIMLTLRAIIFYAFFQKELTPSYQIVKKTFF